MVMKNRAICQIVFNQMSIPVYSLEQGKKALDGIFMIGETIKVEKPVRRRMPRERVVRKTVPARRRGTRAEKTKARREQVGKLFDKGLKKSQIMKQTGASFVTIAKDLEFLGKGKELKGRAKGKKQVKAKGVRKVAKGSKGKQEKPIADTVA